ncbi:MAG: Ig-like domain-containing protein [Ignavibacteriaceae bacterium]|nr:Ig-like domain-containing protein [Ignavibacteriaceae bacterium]MCW9098579.1 Ig-like domain-containing protein [Ignavibacteriaceae bacterium]
MLIQIRLNRKIIFIFFILSFILIKCANQLPPSGGDVDTIPPKIVELNPPDGTTNYDKDYFELEFSEYVDKRSVADAIFISPFIEGSLELSWTGTTLDAVFPEELKKDVTYTITIGTDVVDLNNKNRMAESFTFSFSTGNKIDKKIISGKVYGKEKEGIFIYAYKLVGIPDSLLKNKPDYVSQTGVGGNFSLRGLGEGNYRIFAVNDQYRDYLYQQDKDEIGIPYKDIYLSEEDSIFIDLNYLLFNADTSKPRLISGIMTDRNHLLVSCSKELDKNSIRADNFHLIDSTENKDYNFAYAFKGKVKPEEFILMLNEKINSNNLVYLFADTLTDLLGNTIHNDFVKVVISERPDTSSIKITSTEPAQGQTTDFQKTDIKIFFDEAFNKNLINSAVALTDTFNKPVNFKIDYSDDATLGIKPIENLKPEKDYLLKLQLGKFVDITGNRRDSLFTLNFKTISGLDFTGLSGFVINLDYSKNPVVVLESGEISGLKYEQKLNSEKFEFTRVEPGKYVLWCFLDENNDGKYNYGWPEPIKYSERFSFYPDTLTLRPRWEVTDLNFKFK